MKYLRKAIFITVVFFANQNFAQFQKLQISGGAAFRAGIFPQTGGDEVVMHNGVPIKNKVEFKLGDAMSYDLNFSNIGDSFSIGYGLGLSYVNGFEMRFAENDPDTINETFAYTSLRNRQIQVKPSIWFPFRIGIVKFNTTIGVIVPLQNLSFESTFWNLSSESGKEVREIHYKPSLGIFIRQELLFTQKGRFSIYSGLEFGIQSAKRKNKKIISYTDNQGRGIMDVYPQIFYRELNYIGENEMPENGKLNDRVFNPNGWDENRPREAFTRTDYFNYFGFSIRVAYAIHK